jgi:hypothetical protein
MDRGNAGKARQRLREPEFPQTTGPNLEKMLPSFFRAGLHSGGRHHQRPGRFLKQFDDFVVASGE